MHELPAAASSRTGASRCVAARPMIGRGIAGTGSAKARSRDVIGPPLVPSRCRHAARRTRPMTPAIRVARLGQFVGEIRSVLASGCRAQVRPRAGVEGETVASPKSLCAFLFRRFRWKPSRESGFLGDGARAHACRIDVPKLQIAKPRECAGSELVKHRRTISPRQRKGITGLLRRRPKLPRHPAHDSQPRRH